MGLYEEVSALVTRTTDELKAQRPFLNTVVDTAAVSAYKGGLSRLLTAGGATYEYVPGSTLATVGNMVLAAATAKGAGRWLKNVDSCNVGRDFGADRTGQLNSALSFQQAIDFGTALSAVNGGQFRLTINVPNGFYLIDKAIDLTNRTGITLRGMGGSYINTGLIGITLRNGTSPIVVDATGSSYCGLENLMVLSDAAWGAVASTIGVQVALSEDAQGNQLNGLYARIHNCRIEMHDDKTANSGLGTIAYLNIRSEEGGVTDTTFKANRPAVLSNSATISVIGWKTNTSSLGPVTYTASSAYANVATHGNGSMGVQDWGGRMSLLGVNCWAPALTLQGVNSFRYHGYMGRPVQNAGTFVTAIDTYGQCDGLQISGTIECYPQILNTHGGKITAMNLRIITANQLNPAGVNGCDLTGSPIFDTELRVVFNNPAERANRILFYHAPIGGGNAVATGSIQNSRLSSPEWPDNTTFISANLLRNSQNVELATGQPLRKMAGGYVEFTGSYPFPLGTVGSVSSQLIRFTKADNATTTANNAGSYSVYVDGIILIGGTSAGGGSSHTIQASAVIQQFQNSDKGPLGSWATIVNASGIGGGTSLTGLAIDIDLSGAIGVVKLTPTCGPNGTGELIQFMGSIRFLSALAVNQSILFV